MVIVKAQNHNRRPPTLLKTAGVKPDGNKKRKEKTNATPLADDGQQAADDRESFSDRHSALFPLRAASSLCYNNALCTACTWSYSHRTDILTDAREHSQSAPGNCRKVPCCPPYGGNTGVSSSQPYASPRLFSTFGSCFSICNVIRSISL